MPTATDFQLNIFAALAQEERRLISERTSNAFAEAKRRGVLLGRHGIVLAAQNRRDALDRAEALRASVAPMRRLGLSYSEIARRLNDEGVRTARGGKFHAQQVIL